MSTLDIGCGWLKFHERRGNIGVDIQKGLCDVQCDGQLLPFRDDVFDRVLMYAVLEHMDTPLECLKEAKRVAKTNAELIIEIPVEARGWIKYFRLMILGFPFGVVSVLKQLIIRKKYRKFKGCPHVNRIQPKDIDTVVNIVKILKVSSVKSGHPWFWGRKGRFLRKHMNPPDMAVWSSWIIIAVNK